jgi:hypothetical protein
MTDREEEVEEEEEEEEETRSLGRLAIKAKIKTSPEE